MKIKVLILGLIFLVLIACDKGIENPYSLKLKANIVLDGALNEGYIGDWTTSTWGFAGYVKNIGNGIGFDCVVELQRFSDPNKTTLIDTAYGFPANMGVIAPGQRVRFEAAAVELGYAAFIEVKITWKDAGY